MSWLSSRRWVAKECRKVWQAAGLARPAAPLAAHPVLVDESPGRTIASPGRRWRTYAQRLPATRPSRVMVSCRPRRSCIHLSPVRGLAVAVSRRSSVTLVCHNGHTPGSISGHRKDPGVDRQRVQHRPSMKLAGRVSGKLNETRARGCRRVPQRRSEPWVLTNAHPTGGSSTRNYAFQT